MHNFQKHCWQVALILLLVLTMGGAGLVFGADDPMVFKAVSWLPLQVENGSPCLFAVKMEIPPASLTARWQQTTIVFTAGPDQTWYALAGVDLETQPGEYKLQLEATFSDGKSVREVRSVQVHLASFKTETIHVPQKYVEPGPEALRQITADKEIKKKAFAHQELSPLWSGEFHPPVSTDISEGFGTRRTFNGKLASIHRGLDYHAKLGTPILAANSGEVVLARELFYEGNCVIIDHGQQFMTLYMHMSRLQVDEGQKVQKGQRLGLSGATGRATGPHLHIAVWWQGKYLDPAQLWILKLPSQP